LMMLPVALAIPRLCGLIGAWLDRAWFGRRYAPLDAGRLFLTALQNASTETELREVGEGALAAIFRAPCRIELGLETGAGETRVPIESRGAAVGFIVLGERLHSTPFFSEDRRLAASLAATFAFMLEHVRLHARKQALALEAGRAELKALRAQVNPHFLFNALNAIAGLIHRDPARAEETVEKLAGVFRYTLQRSDSEWVRLEDEFEFVRSYLDVEQARFGDRLNVRMEIAAGARAVKVPAMMVQTLVENAIKHGIAGVLGAGRIAIHAGCSGGLVSISVSDNGAGCESDRAGNGYGLHNVRERLAGYFGAAAKFTLTHDAVTGLTVALIQMPAGAPV
ncbi:MAG: sensor histidine kinase, partial [Bryobacteraceae bacterium]